MTTTARPVGGWMAGVVAVVALVGPGRAAADDYSLHVAGTIVTAWTDNLFSAPDEPPATGTAPAHEGDLYYQLRPGVLVSYDTPRTIHQLTYDLEANLYTLHDSAWSLQHLAGWRGFFMTSPRTELGASVRFSTGQLNALTTREAASSGQLNSGVSGESDYISIDAGEHFSYAATRKLRLTQGARFRRFSTTDALDTDTTGLEAALDLGADRTWKFSAVGIQLGASLVSFDRVTPTLTSSTDQVDTNLVASWRRDFGPRWTALVDVGVRGIVPLDDAQEAVLQPTVGGQLGYFPRWGNASLSLRRAVAPNLYLARNTVTDVAVVSAWLPLPWLAPDRARPTLSVQGTVGAQRSRLIESDGTLASGFDLLSGDLALTYAPREGLAVTARVQHLRQFGASGAVMDLFDYDRTTVLIQATGRFPGRTAAEVPVRESLRVDRSDVTPVGAEVAPSQAPGAE